MNINLIINLSLYFILFLGLLSGFLLGLKRGLRKSAIRLGVLAIFIVIAGLITTPISSALLNVDISSFNISIGGTGITTIPHLIEVSVNSISGFQSAVEAVPSLLSFLDKLPVALLNVVVFFLLILIMQFISWIIYMFIARFALKESKIEKDRKRQRKAEKKQGTKEKQIIPTKPKALPLPLPPKRRLWGATIGTLQSFVLMFLLFIPFTSLFGIVEEISSNPVQIRQSATVHADEEEILYEFSYDLLRNSIGEETFSYFQTFNNSFPSKVLSLGGMNNLIFDSLTKVKVNDTSIAFRQEIVTATKIYDNYMLILDEMGKKENLSDFDFDIVRSIIGLAFELDIVNAFGQEGAFYAATQLRLMDQDTLPYFSEIQDSIDLVLNLYKQDPKGFIPSLKKDFSHMLNVAEVSLSSGLVDRVFNRPIIVENLLTDIKANNYKVLTAFVNEGYSASLVRVATVQGLNIALDAGERKLSSDSFSADLGRANYSKIDWATSKPSIYNIIKNLLDIYDVLALYDLNAFVNNPTSLLSDIDNQDIRTLTPLVGKEIDLIKECPIFNEEDGIPVEGLISWMDNNESVNKFIDASEMLSVSSWKLTLEPLSQSFIGIKDSGVLEALLEEAAPVEELIDLLLEPTSADTNAPSYARQILQPIITSNISSGLIVEILNQTSAVLEESISEITLSKFSKESFPADQKGDITNILENALICFSILTAEGGVDLADIDSSDTLKVSAFFTALQDNTFRKNTLNPVNYNVDFANKTVVGGGLFSNYYISLVTYIFGDSTEINYKNVNWASFLVSSQELYSTLEGLGEGSSMQELFNLGDEESKETLENLLESIGLDPSIAQDLVDINKAVASLNDPESDLSEEEINDIIETIDNALTNLLDSEGEDGKNTVESLIDIIKSVTGEEISEEISLSAIEKEQLVSNRLKLLALNAEVNPIDASNTTPDTVHHDLTLLDATIKDLTCGATYVLQNAYGGGKRIYLSSIDFATLTSKIEASTTDPDIRALVGNVFVITD